MGNSRASEHSGWFAQPVDGSVAEASGTRPSRLSEIVARRLDGYELLCAMGQGGMSSVWAAGRRCEYGLDRLVAIKTIMPHYGEGPRWRAAFIEEARIASRITHINVARILDFGEEADILYVVSEWVSGDSLAHLQRCLTQRGVQMPLGILLHIMADVSAGLHAAHELRDAAGNPLSVVHQHVSPATILLSTRGVAKLIDFGIAQPGGPHAQEAEFGIVPRNPTYTAPEQALGGPADRRADVWAVGATLYRLLAEQAPGEVDDGATLTLGANPPLLPPNIHVAVAAVVHRALRRNPAERFATAGDLSGALRRAMVAARVPATVENVGEFVSKQMADRIAARREAIARAVVFASRAERQTDRGRRVVGRPTEVSDMHDDEPLPMEEQEDETTQVALAPLEGMAGALSVVFGAIVLLAVVMSGFVVWRGQARIPNAPITSVEFLAPAAASPSVPKSAGDPAAVEPAQTLLATEPDPRGAALESTSNPPPGAHSAPARIRRRPAHTRPVRPPRLPPVLGPD